MPPSLTLPEFQEKLGDGSGKILQLDIKGEAALLSLHIMHHEIARAEWKIQQF